MQFFHILRAKLSLSSLAVLPSSSLDIFDVNYMYVYIHCFIGVRECFKSKYGRLEEKRENESETEDEGQSIVVTSARK